MKKYRLLATTSLAFILILSSGVPARSKDDKKAEPVSPASTDTFEIRNIEGWAVYINKQDLADKPDQMAREIDHLQNQFYQTRLTVPAPAVAIMQERVPLWMEYDSDPGLSFHPSYKWLLNKGYPSPEGLKSLVSNCRAKGFGKNALHQPWVVLHELTHGYDFLYLGEGKHYSNPQLKQAYKRAKDSGTYESVLCRYSKGAKHYALSNEMEYFAENTEAYFGTNDFYPFVRAELKEHDPTGYALLQTLWGVDIKEQRRTERSLATFLDNKPAPTLKAAKRKTYTATSKYEKHKIEGWNVYLDPSLARQKAYGDEMAKLLRYKLHLVKRYMPEKSLEHLQKVPIWIEQNNRAIPYMTYHASAENLKAANQNPDKLRSIEIGNTERFRQWQGIQQFAVLNQLARAYYDQVLSNQAGKIKEAWQKVRDSKKYDSVLRFDGKHVRHPALASPVEYFAEMTEAYYGVNDHYPFIQFEARQYDPNTCRLLEELWGGKAK